MHGLLPQQWRNQFWWYPIDQVLSFSPWKFFHQWAKSLLSHFCSGPSTMQEIMISPLPKQWVVQGVPVDHNVWSSYPLYIKVVEGQIAFSVNIGHWKDEGLLLDHLFGSLFIRQCYSRIVFNSPIGPHAKSTLLSQTIWPEYFRTKANSIWSICKFQNMYYAQVHLHYILIFEIHLSLQLAGFMNPFTVPVQSCRTLDCILDEMFHIKRIRLIH